MNLLMMNLFTNTINTIMIAYFLIKILGKAWVDKKRWILYLTSLIVFNTFMNSIFGLANILGFITILTISTIVYSYLLDTEFIKVLIYSILGTILMFIVEIIFITIVTMVCDIEPCVLLEVNSYRIISILGVKVMFYLTIRYVVGKLKGQLKIKPSVMKPIIIIGFFNIIIIFMTFALYKNISIKSSMGYVFLIGMGLGSIIFSWLTYTICGKIIYQSHQEAIWEMKEEEFHKKDFYLKNMNDILQTIKSQKHDLNNYLSTLYGLIYLGKFEEAKKYITEINNRTSNMINIIETNHPVITALITMKKNKAFEHNINMVLDIDLPEKLQLDFVDLSIIMGNLLDNAIEACELIKDETKRKIQLSIYIKELYLIIEIINTKVETGKIEAKNVVGRFTTKDDHESHGYGLGNIEYVVKQYNGTMDIEDLGNEFRVDIALLIDD